MLPDGEKGNNLV